MGEGGYLGGEARGEMFVAKVYVCLARAGVLCEGRAGGTPPVLRSLSFTPCCFHFGSGFLRGFGSTGGGYDCH
ncbi:hypothetical protein THIOKS13320040 [Thiocapsa sp. KS1]|nr:hypothetical protein THIOKS13320040 [Thiocapsa sp. KS1]